MHDDQLKDAIHLLTLEFVRCPRYYRLGFLNFFMRISGVKDCVSYDVNAMGHILPQDIEAIKYIFSGTDALHHSSEILYFG